MKRLVAVVLVLAAAILGPAPAFAHASLENSEPTAGAVLDASPETVTIRFSEAVGIQAAAIRLFDASGSPVDIGASRHPDGQASAVTASLPPLVNALYVVSWRAVSADGHPVRGAYTFTVGPATVVDPGSVVSEILKGTRASPAVSLLSGLARGLFLLCFALLIGMVSFPALTGIGRTDEWRRAALLATTGSAVSGLLALLLAVPAGAARGLGSIGSSSAWAALFQTVAGWASAVRLGVLVVATVVAFAGRTRRTGQLLTRAHASLLLVAIVASGWAGHGGSGRWVPVGVSLTMLHVLAMGVWFGGLAALTWLVLRGDTEPDARVIRRFSTAAFVSVVVLAASGIVQAWRQLGVSNRLTSLATYTSNSFGRFFVIKTAVVMLMVGVAAFSRRAVRRRSGIGLRPLVLTELGLGVAVLALTSALVVANPAGSATGTGSVTVDAQDDAVAVSLFVEPARTGPNTLHLTLRSPDFGADVYDNVTVRATLASRDIGPLDIALEPAGTNHFTAKAAQFPAAGKWTVTVAVLVSEFDRRVFTLNVRIRP